MACSSLKVVSWFRTATVTVNITVLYFDTVCINIQIKLFRILYIYIYMYKCKGKSVPLQAWTGPEGSRKLRFPDLVTMAQDGGKVVSLTHRPSLHPGNTPGTHFF